MIPSTDTGVGGKSLLMVSLTMNSDVFGDGLMASRMLEGEEEGGVSTPWFATVRLPLRSMGGGTADLTALSLEIVETVAPDA